MATAAAPAASTRASSASTRASSIPPPVALVSDVVARQRDRNFGRGKAFGKATFDETAKEHVATHEMNSKPPKTTTNGTNGPVVIRNVATFAENHFFENPVTNALCSVKDDVMASQAQALGYQPRNITHYTDAASIPPIASADSQPTSHANMSNRDLVSVPRPSSIEVFIDPEGKKRAPNLFQLEGETVSMAVLRAFEDKVIDPVEGRERRVFSPYREWTDGIRKENNISDSKLTKLFRAYCVVRTALGDDTPSDCKKTIKQLNNVGLRKPDGSWHAEAVGVYENYISSA